MKKMIIGIVAAFVAAVAVVQAQMPAAAPGSVSLPSITLTSGAPLMVNGVLAQATQQGGAWVLVPVQAAPAPVVQQTAPAAVTTTSVVAPPAQQQVVYQQATVQRTGPTVLQRGGSVLGASAAGAGEGAIEAAITGQNIGKIALGRAAGRGGADVVSQGLAHFFGANTVPKF